ncbi:MAG TPA: glycosyltransferase [Bryobacteraceae bacterium]|nr:glycosyltransferase [Bryobacteraceae bacterium]
MHQFAAAERVQQSDARIAPAVPRVAFLSDTFHEVNGAARTCRELTAFANRRGYPFFSVRFSGRESFAQQGSSRILELRRSPISIGVDPDLRFDLAFYRLRTRLEAQLREFAPDVIHVIGPGELGILGAIAAWRMRVPLVVSWHTNIHEYAARRFPLAWPGLRRRIQEFVLQQILRLYQRGAGLLAPSPELVEMLQHRTGHQAFLMTRGVDAVAFSPEHRRRVDDTFVIGYVGRLMPEKGVRFFSRLERYLENAGVRDFRIFLAGWGSQERWLRRHLRHAEFQGILDPQALGRAYANMDLFVFPSRTDTFGNVVQEALASGVPALVTNGGGPQTIVGHGVTGLVAANEEELCGYVLRLIRRPEERIAMGAAGRQHMLTRSWDDVFEKVYRTYAACVDRGTNRAA